MRLPTEAAWPALLAALDDRGYAVLPSLIDPAECGELAALYALADVAFVGGSLVPRGGHNIIEPAQYGVAIMTGNHTENFRDIVALFQSRDAVRIVSAEELPLMLMQLVADNDQRHALGLRAQETLRSQQGATARTIEALRTLLAPNSSSNHTKAGNM